MSAPLRNPSDLDGFFMILDCCLFFGNHWILRMSSFETVFFVSWPAARSEQNMGRQVFLLIFSRELVMLGFLSCKTSGRYKLKVLTCYTPSTPLKAIYNPFKETISKGKDPLPVFGGVEFMVLKLGICFWKIWKSKGKTCQTSIPAIYWHPFCQQEALGRGWQIIVKHKVCQVFRITTFFFYTTWAFDDTERP